MCSVVFVGLFISWLFDRDYFDCLLCIVVFVVLFVRLVAVLVVF